MNPEQLWETTLDRNARSLLQVKIKEGDEAEDLFVKLMGDVVEPRREFIQDNALNVANSGRVMDKRRRSELRRRNNVKARWGSSPHCAA